MNSMICRESRSVFCRLVASTACVLALSCCGSGDADPEGAEVVDVTGQWSGTPGSSLIIEQGCGASEVAYVLNLTQVGSDITGDSSHDCSGLLNYDLQGSISDNQVILTELVGFSTISLLVKSETDMGGTMIDSNGVTIAEVRLSR